MRKIILILSAIIISTSLLTGCHTVTKTFGGSMTIELEPNTKLELITWKEDSLWYCTRPMREEEFPETHTYKQQSEFGVFEGTVTIIETR